MSSNPVPLIRKFSLVQADEKANDEPDFSQLRSTSRENTWDILDEKYRCIILAEAGAGKSYEMESRAKYLANQGKTSFYIRIEYIKDDFEISLEVDCFDSFSKWLNSDEDMEAWFFLDSVDEARLKHPRSFEDAIKHFNNRINKASQRAHIFISSRPYAWRFQTDQRLVEKYLPFKINQHEDNENVARKKSEYSNKKEPLDVYTLAPLTEDDIRLFANHRNTPEIDQLITELQQKNLSSISERPFDLEIILGKWKSDQSLDGRLELLRYNINHGLTERNPDRRQQTLSIEEAQLGARILAAAVILTGASGIRIPEDSYSSVPNRSFLAENILKGWEQPKIQTLLEQGIFNDVLYRQVRFRHREVRELLAAEWFYELLQQGNSRLNIETLFFRTVYGERVITPRLRPVLAWLLLFDDNVRNQVMEISPEIALEGGDIAYLSLADRQGFLKGIVERVSNGNANHSVYDHDAITRIAHKDLSATVLDLIQSYSNNDPAIYFLALLASQTGMNNCVPKLLTIATSTNRNTYVRTSAATAVMCSGDSRQKMALWNRLISSQKKLPRDLLSEIIRNTNIDPASIDQTLQSIKILETKDIDGVDSLDYNFQKYIDRIFEKNSNNLSLTLVSGLHNFIKDIPQNNSIQIVTDENHSPHCHEWLVPLAAHALECLIKSRSSIFPSQATSILQLFDCVLKLERNSYENANKLIDLVPEWPELNDTIFWRDADKERSNIKNTSTKLAEDILFKIDIQDHYWHFSKERFRDVIDYISKHSDEVEKLIALTLAHQVFKTYNKPEDWLQELQKSTEGSSVLKDQLKELIQLDEKYTNTKRNENNHREEKVAENKSRDLQNRQQWINSLKGNLHLIHNSRNLKKDAMSNTQYLLLKEIDSSTTRSEGANWEKLIPNFGYGVAYEFRKIAVNFWRQFDPGLGSEGANINSWPYSLRFALSGLLIEALETTDFPSNLSNTEIRHALRYLVWELGELPSWLEVIHKSHPQLVQDAITTELFWELEKTTSDQPKHYILHKLVSNAHYLHEELAGPILGWLTTNEIPNNDNLRLCIQIISSSQKNIAKTSSLAQSKTNTSTNQLPTWYALWINVDAKNSIPALEKWLSKLPIQEARKAAQHFITKLIPNEHHNRFNEPMGYQSFNSPIHLKSLYLLMHQYIEGTNTRPFPRSLQEKGQAARESLLKMLTRIEGKAAHAALYQLKTEHPDPERHPWMAKEAYKRAEEDSDMTSWTTEDVYSFNKNQIKPPSNNRELYELAINQLKDLRDWLENGNDSPYQTWQKAGNETEMRNLIAGVLNNNSNGRYNCAQEYELANSQRPDILIQAPKISSPVPIELKLLDKSWSGPKLRERLKNQLAGDYLREEAARNGIMLLVWQGKKNTKRWSINNKNVSLIDLEEALREYWMTISEEFPEVDDLEVIVIDLTVRGLKSEDATPKP